MSDFLPVKRAPTKITGPQVPGTAALAECGVMSPNCVGRGNRCRLLGRLAPNRLRAGDPQDGEMASELRKIAVGRDEGSLIQGS
jgi:hypothetical protein